MTHFAESFAWCMLQVTCFSLAATVLYLIVRRRTVRSYVTLLVMSLTIVALLTVGSVSPWPRWGWLAWRAEESSKLFPVVDEVRPGAEAVTSEAFEESSPAVTNPMAIVASPDPTDGEAALLAKVTVDNKTAPMPWWIVAVGVAWIASDVGALRLILGMVYLRRYRRESATVMDASMRQMFDELHAEYEIDRPVALLESPQLGVAATIGWRCPTVLLPHSWREWSADERRAVLAHELAHVRERHFPTWLLGQLAVVTHFYHPLVHWLAQRLRLEQEIAADQLAARVFGDRRRYAAILAGLALESPPSRSAFASVGLFMSRPFLMRRIAMLDQSADAVSSGSRSKKALLLGLLILVAVGVAGLRTSRGEDDPSTSTPSLVPRQIAADSSSGTDIATNDTPSVPSKPVPNAAEKSAGNSYYATALFQVSREPESLLGQPKQVMSDGAWQIFYKTQIALLHSYFVLQSALRDKEIRALPIIKSQTDPTSWLVQHIDAGFYPESEIMYIRMVCVTENQEEVKKLVDAVAKAYIEEVVYKGRQERLVTFDALTRSYAKLREELKVKMDDYYNIAKELGAVEAGGSAEVEQQIDLKRIDRIESELMRLEDEQLQPRDQSKEQLEYYEKRIAQLEKRHSALMEKLKSRVDKSVDLETRKGELDQLQKIAGDMSVKLEMIEIESVAPARIKQIQQAVVQQGEKNDVNKATDAPY